MAQPMIFSVRLFIPSISSIFLSFPSFPLRGSVALWLNPTESGKSPVHGDHDAGDESRGGRQQPQCRAYQIARLAEAPHRRVRDDAPSALGRLTRLFIDQQASVLLCDEEAGR